MAKVIFEKEPQEFVLKLAGELKKMPEFAVPDWAFFVKSGVGKQRPPESEDFWFVRTASILRQMYIKGVVGVSRLRTRYGSRKNRGMKPARFRKASGKMIRTMLQQSEKAGFVEKVTKNQIGRRLTLAGRQFLDSIKVETKTE
jgi:small subunit ribosomal protein S19e